MTMYHHVKRTYTTFPVKRTDRYGNSLPSPGFLQAHCDCGWERGIRHNGLDQDEQRNQFDKLIHEHTDSPDKVPDFFEGIKKITEATPPNQGHPVFQVKKFTKQVEIEAMFFNPDLPEGSAAAIQEWVRKNGGKCSTYVKGSVELHFPIEGTYIIAKPGHWIVKDSVYEGGFLPCSEEYLKKNYWEKMEPRRFSYPVC